MAQQAINNIVVGVDGSAHATTALQWACVLADAQGATVEALWARVPPIRPLMPALGASRAAADQQLDSPRSRLARIVASVTTQQPVQQSVVIRSPQFALEQASQDADLVVVGRTGRGRIENLLVGSTAAYCVHNCSCPVAVVGEQLPGSDILVAVDGSDRSVDALAWALRTWPLQKVRAVYSHDESILDELALGDQERLGLDTKAQHVVDQVITQACVLAGVDESLLVTEVRSGDPRTTIVSQLAPDQTLILGTQGYSGFAGWVLGSLADFALHQALGTIIVHR